MTDIMLKHRLDVAQAELAHLRKRHKDACAETQSARDLESDAYRRADDQLKIVYGLRYALGMPIFDEEGNWAWAIDG